MKIVIKQSQLTKDLMSFQKKIPAKVKCKRCKEEARIFMQVIDDTGELIKERPEKVEVWPHDASVTTIYLCTTCGMMRATWNQA